MHEKSQLIFPQSRIAFGALKVGATWRGAKCIVHKNFEKVATGGTAAAVRVDKYKYPGLLIKDGTGYLSEHKKYVTHM